MRTASGIYLPPVPQRRPCGERRRKPWSPTMMICALVDPDGSIAWQDDEWILNGLHDAGEQEIQQDWLQGQAISTKYLGLLNDGTIAETDGTMTAVTESKTTGVDGYNRQQILTSDWTNDGLQGGDYRFSAAEKTFGPITGTSATATHTSLSTTSTGAGILLLTLALSATTTIAVNQSFKVILRSTVS